MKTIFKYKLKNLERSTIQMPANGFIFSAGFDAEENICVWAMIDKEEPLEDRTVWVLGTGWEVEDMIKSANSHNMMLTFHSTIVDKHGYVWHCFAENPKEKVSVCLV